MELDMLIEADAPLPWPDGQRAAEHHAFKHTIEQVQLADKMGFRTCWFVEHHFRKERSHCSAPEVLIGALSQITENIRLGFGVVLMPHGFTHPIRVAEKVATADHLTDGRLEWGTGRSTPLEQTGFGVPMGEESRDQWRDAVQTVVAAWEADDFSWKSKYLTFPGDNSISPTRSVVPKPWQDPHPPVWSAAVTARSSRIVGEAGMGLLSFSILQSVDQMAEQIAAYREGIANAKPLTKVTTDRVAAYTLVHCVEDAAEIETNGIWDAVWWWYQNYAETALRWDFAELDDDQKEKIFPLLKERAEGRFEVRDFADADMIIVGDVDTVVEKMLRYYQVGVDQLICYSAFGGLSHEAVMKSIEMLGTKVLPKLRERFPEIERLTIIPAEQDPDAPFQVGFTPGGVEVQGAKS